MKQCFQHDRNLDLLHRAKEQGYFIRCIYVLTVDPAINMYRVFSRVASGGHPVPKDKIISRWHKALGLVPELIGVCDIVHMYDNSDERSEFLKSAKRKPLPGRAIYGRRRP